MNSLSVRFLATAVAVAIFLAGIALGSSFWRTGNSRAEANRYEVLDPRGAIPARPRSPLSPRLTELDGKTIYLIRSWPTEDAGFDTLLAGFSSYLEERYRDVRVLTVDRNVPYARDDPRLWAQLRDNADAFVYAAAPSATTTHYSIVWSALLEEMQLPGVALLFEPLSGIQRTSIELVRPPVRHVAVPYPAVDLPEASLTAIFERVIGALTDPLTEAESRARVADGDPRAGVLYRGTDDDIQAYYYREGLTDGLPIVPPTRQRVDAMLTGTSHAPTELVAESMQPGELDVTVEKVAINGVLAGCGPEHLPVLIAALEAFQSADRAGAVRTTNSFALMQVVNGPIREALGINSSTGVLAPGNRSNACLGRALRLFITNLGGWRVGENMMAQIGNIATYPFVIAENEERSPWTSLSVERGFDADESTLTMMVGAVGTAGSYGPWSFRLEHVAEDIAEFELYRMGATVIVTPPRAAELAAQGITKARLKDFLVRSATKSLGELRTTRFFSDTEETAGRPAASEVPVYAPGSIEVIVAGGHASPQMQAWNVGRPVTVSIDKWR